MNNGLLFFVGTYANRGSLGIYKARLDPATGGGLTVEGVGAKAANPTFLARSPNRRSIYAVSGTTAWVKAYRTDPRTGILDPIGLEEAGAGRPPCHVAADRTGRCILATHFHLGTIAAIPLRPDGSPGVPRIVAHQGHGPHPIRQAGPHPHSATIAPDNRFALVCDLGLDRIFSYRLDPETAALTPGPAPFAAAEPGAGPRHLAFGPDGTRVYVVNEINNTVAVYAYEAGSGALARQQVLPTLPRDFTGESSAAEVALHPNGRFLYASNRGHDSLALFSIQTGSGQLSPLGHFPCGGKAPRHFALSPDGAWLVCAHQDSDTLCSFQVDPASGRLRRVPGEIRVPVPTCVLF